MRELSGKSPLRGRNGWFQAKQISAWGGNSNMIEQDSPTVEVGIHSKQIGDHPPIWMWLTLEDARALVGEITNAIVDAQNQKCAFCEGLGHPCFDHESKVPAEEKAKHHVGGA